MSVCSFPLLAVVALAAFWLCKPNLKLARTCMALSTGTPSHSHSALPTLQPLLKFQSRRLYTSLGCWTDSSTSVMPYYYGDIHSKMPSSCITACYNLGYLYAGIENGYECLCGDVYSTLGSSTQCTNNCNGNDKINSCGGVDAISVYASGVTSSPTLAPTTRTPTASPTRTPTAAPTASPTAVPTASPTTAAPSRSPTSAPTSAPSQAPTTAVPTANPTPTPTSAPSASPTTAAPSAKPTATPTSSPTASPTTTTPTAHPTAAPSSAPTFLPTSLPSAAPTSSPTSLPSATPTAMPTSAPSSAPTSLPTSLPSAAPTSSPTPLPSAAPTAEPTSAPTQPTPAPSSQPTAAGATSSPSELPTSAPSPAPSIVSTPLPSVVPTSQPTAATSAPSEAPSLGPMPLPSALPTSEPTAATSAPSEAPSLGPTPLPSALPTSEPTATTSAPSEAPGLGPTPLPSALPTSQRTTSAPSEAPSLGPTPLPSALPTSQPTTSAPSEAPSLGPTPLPSALPTSIPTQAPTATSPTSAPTTLCASLPSVSIEGASSLAVYRANELKLFAVASLEGCSLSYAWGETGGLHFTSTSSDPRYLALAPYTLTAGGTYTFTVTVTTAPGSSATASVAVSVLSSNVAVAVKGGDATVYTGNSATLDASWTVDADDASGYCSACVYSFSCLTRTGQACGISLLPLTAGSASAVTIPGNSLTGGITYDFTVTAIRSGSLSSTTVVSLYAVDNQVNANQGSAIVAATTAAAFSAATASWSLVSGSFAGDLSFDDARASVATYSVKAGSTKATSLVFPADVLVPGTTYTLQLTAAYLSTGATGYTSVSFSVNDAPSGGTFYVSPADGAPLDTFTFNAIGWSDQDLPLTYTFAYITGTNDDATDEVVVRTKRSAETSEVYLPQGSGAAYSIIAVGYIYDVWGASSRATFAVTVRPRSVSVVSFSASALSLLGPAQLAGDTDGLFQVVGMLNVALNANNCSAAPNCTDIGRFDCSESTGSGTCGYCLSGYSGVVGSGNTPCLATSEAPTHCSDGVANEDETDVDCGGSECQVCDSGYRCANATDCRFGSCESGVCGAQQKSCIDDCSGQGTCAFIDSGGTEVAAGDCSVEMLLCHAACRCNEGYYGETCQYNTTEFDAVLAIRNASIDALAAVEVDKTQESLGQLASALSQALTHPVEVPSDAMEVVLQVALNVTAASSTLGLLPATGTATASVIDAVLTAALLGEASFSSSSLEAITSNLLQALAVDMEVGQDATTAAAASTAFSAVVVEIGGDDVNTTAALSVDASALDKTPAQVWLPADAPILASSAYSSAVVGIASFGLNPRPNSNTTFASNVLRFFLAGHDQSSRRRRRRLSGVSCHAGESPPLLNTCGPLGGACLPGNAIILSAPSDAIGSASRAALEIAITSGSRVAEVQNRRAASSASNTSFMLLTLSNDATDIYSDGDVEEIQASCDWDEYGTRTGTCSDGTQYSVACDGVASNTTISCPANITVQYCASASGSDDVYASTSCSVASYSSASTVCQCEISASLFGFGSTKAGDASSSLVDEVSDGGLQADFATVFLATPKQLLIVASYASLLTPEVLAQNIIALSLLLALLALAAVAACCGWRLDRRDRLSATDAAAGGQFPGDAYSGKETQRGSSSASRITTRASTGASSFEAAQVQESSSASSRLRLSAIALLMTSSRHRRPKVAAGNFEDEEASEGAWSPRSSSKATRGLVVNTGNERLGPEAKYQRNGSEVQLHHFGSARFRKRFFLLLKTRHELFNIYFLFSESFSRPQRVAYFLSTVLSLMALDATVSSYIYGSGAPCLSLHTRSECLDVADGYGEDTTCIWQAKSGSCTYGQASVGLESAAIISTVALIFRLPLDILAFLVFRRFIARPTRTSGAQQQVTPDSPSASTSRPLMASGHGSSTSWPGSPSGSVSPGASSSAKPTFSNAVSDAAVADETENAMEAMRVSVTGLSDHSEFDSDGPAARASASSRRSVKESRVSVHRRNRAKREAELKERVAHELAAFIIGEKQQRRGRGAVYKGAFGLLGRPSNPALGGIPLRRKVEVATAAALELEEDMSKLAPTAAEKKLFEVAQAESLGNVERRVFLRTRLVDKDYYPAPVPRWQKLLAWAGVLLYIASLVFYVFLFEAREGERTSRIWATSFAFALLQDIAIFTPLKLSIVFLFVPSLMRHRLHPDMFRNIPRYASSVQIARRRPDLQVSELILDGRIPRGSEYAEFIPPAMQHGWTTAFTALLFSALALLFAVPEEIQGGILDTVITAASGLFVIGVHRWCSAAPLELAAAAAVVAIVLAVAWRRHQKQVIEEDEARAKAAAVSLRRKAFPTSDADEDGEGAIADEAEKDTKKLAGMSSGVSSEHNVTFWSVEEVEENEIL